MPGDRHRWLTIDPDLQALTSGFAWPTPVYLVGALIFSLIGYAAFRRGRRNDSPRALWTGVALMLYPYVVSNTVLLYVVGFALCAVLWFVRD